MSAFKRKDRDGWWYYRRVVRLPDGTKERIHGKAPLNTKAAAERAEREHIERLLNPPPPPPKLAPVFRDFAAEFMEGYAKANNKPSEISGKRTALNRHLLPRVGDLRLDEIGRRQIDRIKAEMAAAGKKPKTINNTLAVLSKILSYAVETGDLVARPKMGLAKIAMQPFRFLDFEEYEALCKAAEPEPMWHAAVLLGGDAGLRRGEIRAIEWRHIHTGTGQLTVAQALWRDEMGPPKGGVARQIPMTARLAAALKRARHLRGRFILAGKGGEFATLEAMRWNLPRLCRKAGIEEIGWHALRHTFCSHLAMRGAPAKTIQELAGHQDLHTTLRYMHLARGEKARAIALLDQPWTPCGPGQVADAEMPRKS